MYEGKCAEVLSFYSKTGRSSGATLVRRPIPLRSESIVYNFDPCTVTLMSVHASEFSNCIELMQPDIKESFRFLFFSFIKGGGGATPFFLGFVWLFIFFSRAFSCSQVHVYYFRYFITYFLNEVSVCIKKLFLNFLHIVNVTYRYGA